MRDRVGLDNTERTLLLITDVAIILF